MPGRSISEAGDEIDSLEAEIEQASAEVGRLGEEIAKHVADGEAAAAERSRATALRKKGRGDFVATLTDFTESIDAIGRALKLLKEEKKCGARGFGAGE